MVATPNNKLALQYGFISKYKENVLLFLSSIVLNKSIYYSPKLIALNHSKDHSILFLGKSSISIGRRYIV